MKLPQQTPMTIYACCLPVKGISRSLICDVQRKSHRFIPNVLHEILTKHIGKTIAQIKALFKHQYDEILEEYFATLYQEEYIFFTEEIAAFPPMSMHWESASTITNAIIDVHNSYTHEWETLIEQLPTLACKHVQIRVFEQVGLAWIEAVMQYFQDKKILSVEWLVPYTSNLAVNDFGELKKLTHHYPRISFLMLHSAPQTGTVQTTGKDMGNIHISTAKANSAMHCGIIQPQKFSINVHTFTESQQHNSCLNRKIGIDKNGYIKNCPSMQQHFGHVSNTTLASVVNDPNFTKYWHIKKDDIAKCKACEFRHICTDCRAFVDDPNDLYAAPLKCGYNPETCEWEDWSTHPLKQTAIAQYGFAPVAK